ncbi:GntR family transcriptional regulator [Phormidium tenue FACHB-886]|nr:GntR family transcriptional regulator [Phormidium tenue FACHB-886]
MLSSQPIHRSKSLHEQTYQALRSSILSGRLAPGDRLIETQIAQQLQVSRTPIREAMRQLQREGLINGDTNEGLRVTSISAADAIHLYDCRIGLEQISVAGACEHITAAQLQTLENMILQAEELMQQAASDLANTQLLDLDYQFHHTIADSAGNKWLVALLDQVFDKMTLLRLQTTRQNPKVLELRVEHRQIFEAIAQRDRAAAVETIRNHLVASKERVIHEVQQFYQQPG